MSGLHAALDAPNSNRIDEGDIRFAGWCFHSGGELRNLVLTVNEAEYPVRFAMERPDVGDAFPGVADAPHSGFLGSVTLKAGTYRIGLKADVAGLPSQTLILIDGLLVAQAPARQKLTQKWLRSPGGFLLQRWRRRVARGEGLPRLKEIPSLIRDAADDYARTRSRRTGGSGKFTAPSRLDPYDVWLRFNEWTSRRDAELRARLSTVEGLPRISIVTPVFRPKLEYFAETTASVAGQVYKNWEWCLADDASGDPQLTTTLEGLAERDERVRLINLSENVHISRATNAAAGLATGEFLAFLDHDDLLSPDALAEVAIHLASHPDVDVLYTDDDKVDVAGRRYSPQFKPDWSPESLLSQMYFSHLLVIRRALFNDLGGFREGFEGSQDHDLALRAVEKARRIAHLPFVLYHWRAVPGSTAASGDAKSYSFEAGLRSVSDALERRGITAQAERPDWAVRAGASLIRHRFPNHGPSVAIIIATRNGKSLLQRCLTSLAKTTYANYEVVIIDDDSDDPETLNFFATLPHKVIRRDQPRTEFNFAALHNFAARAVSAEYLLFLNNDTEVRNPDWLSQMMGFAQLEGVGAVGARLLFPNHTVQHAGIMHGFDQGSPALAFRGLPSQDPGYLAAARVCRNYSAVTAACMLTSRQLFLDIGGFDETAFAVSFNDVDYCYRLVDQGWRCVYAAEAELLHHEGASRGIGSKPDEIAEFRRRYHQRGEPYFNPNLSTTSELFQVQPRRVLRRPAERVRAIMFSHSLGLTGAPWCQLELTVSLRDSGVLDPLVVSLEDGPLRARYEALGIPVRLLRLPLEKLRSPREYDDAIAGVQNEILESGAQVVYANTLNAFFAIDAAHRLELPSLWNVRESEPWPTYFSNLPDFVADKALGCFAYPYRVIFVSRASRAVYEELNSHHNFAVVHDGLELSAWDERRSAWNRDSARRHLQIPASDVVLLLLGTVCERKGQHDLAKALADVSSGTAGRVRCFFVGDRPGDYSRRLKHLIDSLPHDLASRCHVVPETSDVAPYYAAADIFVCTSRIESYPRVTLEAMASGLPIISTPVFGLSEQLVEGVNAMFYTPADTMALAAAIDRLVGDPRLRAEMAAESRVVFAGLKSFDEMIGNYAMFFQEAADSH